VRAGAALAARQAESFEQVFTELLASPEITRCARAAGSPICDDANDSGLKPTCCCIAIRGCRTSRAARPAVCQQHASRYIPGVEICVEFVADEGISGRHASRWGPPWKQDPACVLLQHPPH